ncbi:MAG TPA: methyltransferase [Parapedobacter sp.]|nr:methyltransferase [Parapedobacter sp.]
MKINTDGVLLGAMATADFPMRMLDVGAGTGVISLMLAQRFPLAMVDAIEIDTMAASTTRRNFERSPFRDRLTSHAIALSEFEPKAGYDLIVSNPPFFLGSLRNADSRKGIARHTDMNFFDQLLARSKQWLSPDGYLQMILPTSMAARVEERAFLDYGLALRASTAIRSFSSHPPIRQVLFLSRATGPEARNEAEFIIYDRRGVYSAAYRKLLGPFFLAF